MENWINNIMLIKEVFSRNLNYTMFGWITKSGAVKLPSLSDSRSNDVIFHEDISQKFGISIEHGDIRFYIAKSELWLEGMYTTDSRKYIYKGVKQIEKLCTNSKNFRHFYSPKAGANGAEQEQIIINKYYMDVVDPVRMLSKTVVSNTISGLLSLLDAKFLSEDAGSGGTSSGGIAGSMGGGNGFLNGGPGTVTRQLTRKKVVKEAPKEDEVAKITKQFADFARNIQ